MNVVNGTQQREVSDQEADPDKRKKPKLASGVPEGLEVCDPEEYDKAYYLGWTHHGYRPTPRSPRDIYHNFGRNTWMGIDILYLEEQPAVPYMGNCIYCFRGGPNGSRCEKCGGYIYVLHGRVPKLPEGTTMPINYRLFTDWLDLDTQDVPK